jgi:putative FmdB family regulatory protein
MPFYTFECPGCGKTFDKMLSMANRNVPQLCPHCLSHYADRKLDPPNVKVNNDMGSKMQQREANEILDKCKE